MATVAPPTVVGSANTWNAASKGTSEEQDSESDSSSRRGEKRDPGGDTLRMTGPGASVRRRRRPRLPSIVEEKIIKGIDK
jgi:hypothetical protein